VINYLGLPSVSFPAASIAPACPIGVQIAGRPFGEGSILRVADAYQRDSDWHERIRECEKGKFTGADTSPQGCPQDPDEA
jgi:Asp-tRNA(Asn)/Glu-tRNA(Gln) amidotransferase A subunit family amidase